MKHPVSERSLRLKKDNEHGTFFFDYYNPLGVQKCKNKKTSLAKKIFISDNLQTRFSLIFCLRKNSGFHHFQYIRPIFIMKYWFYPNIVKTRFVQNVSGNQKNRVWNFENCWNWPKNDVINDKMTSFYLFLPFWSENIDFINFFPKHVL